MGNLTIEDNFYWINKFVLSEMFLKNKKVQMSNNDYIL